MTARLLYVLSPAKTLDMARTTVSKCSEPALLADAHALVCVCVSLYNVFPVAG